MSKRERNRHRYTGLVHTLYGIAVLCALVYGVLLLGDFPERWASLAFALSSSLPLAAFVIDAVNTETPEETE
jgi:hypothetical protein